MQKLYTRVHMHADVHVGMCVQMECGKKIICIQYCILIIFCMFCEYTN